MIAGELDKLEKERVDQYLKIAVVTRFLALAGIVAAIQLPQMQPFDPTIAYVFIGIEIVANSAYLLLGFKRWPLFMFHFSGLVDIVALGYLIHMTGGSASNFAPLLSLVIVFNCIFYGRIGVLTSLVPSVLAYIVASVSSTAVVRPSMMAVDIGSWLALAFLASVVGEREKKDRELLREAATEARRRATEIRTIYETSAGIESHFEVEALLTEAVDRSQRLAAEMWGDVVTSITLFSPDRTTLTVKRVGGENARAAEDMVIPAAILPKESLELLTGGETSITAASQLPEVQQMFSLPEEALFLSVPLTVGSTAFGTLAVRISNGSKPHPSQIEVFETIANHVASALSRARLIEAEKKRRSQATSLFELARDLSHITDLDEVLKRISKAAVEIAEVEVASVALVSPEGLTVTKIEYAVAEGDGPDSRAWEQIGDIPLAWIADELQAHRPVIITDLDTLPSQARDVCALFGVESIAVLPVFTNSHDLHAVLALGRVVKSTWAMSQLQVGEALSGLAAVVLSNAQNQSVLEARSRENAALFSVAQLVTASLDRQEVLNRITAACLAATGSRWASIFLVQEQGLTPQAFKAEASIEVAWHLERFEVTPQVRAWLRSAEVKTFDPAEEDLVPTASLGPVSGEKVTAVPLVLRGEPLGALLLETTDDIRWIETVLRGIGLLASAAIDNANRYESEKEAVAELKRLDRLKNEFVSTASHELRSPLTSITGYAKTLLRRGDEFSEDQRREFLQIIDKQARQLARLVDDLLTVSKMEEGRVSMVFHPVDLKELAQHLVETVRVRTEVHTFIIDIPPEVPPLVADETKLTEIVSNLLDNAIKYSPEGGRITVSARVRSGEVEVAVSDEGPGMPQEVLEKVFQRFYQAQERTTAGGAGLGLYIVQKLVEAHRGRIWATSEEGKGTTFFFAIPQRRATDMVGK